MLRELTIAATSNGQGVGDRLDWPEHKSNCRLPKVMCEAMEAGNKLRMAGQMGQQKTFHTT